ncbi:MAG TPA: Nif3-like dinuclear metal center hexameric protein [Solirubrobacteraceae bacterium]|nr:Nif3-like dinuclear metal center hexameric protein [Solirubrobacteraceae bacterium]
MPSVADLVHELDQLLDVERFDDPGVNGLQVPGAAEVSTLVTGVSANRALLERAAAAGADLVIVHHGLFWRPGMQRVDAVTHGRLRIIFDGGMALAAYHLPLDAHREHGNAALLAGALGMTPATPFAVEHGQPLGWVAIPDRELTLSELVERTARATGREPQTYGSGAEHIALAGIVTGGGADYLEAARDAGAQALVTGEVTERSPGLAEELGMHLIAAGHHATERFGVRSIGEMLAREHGIAHTFIDIENSV